MQLVLSLFPGIDALGRAFSLVGYSVVLGPDLLWDSAIETFHVPPGRFDGVIGGHTRIVQVPSCEGPVTAWLNLLDFDRTVT